MAGWTRGDVIAAVRRDFPEKNIVTVLSILDRFEDASSESGRSRVQIAILRLSKGDYRKLLHNTDVAIKDYRDVLWWSDTSVTPE